MPLCFCPIWGSIKCNAAYHHLNNYGTNSLVVTIGKIHKEQVTDENGNVRIRDVVALGATADERIADGFYFASSCGCWNRYWHSLNRWRSL